MNQLTNSQNTLLQAIERLKRAMGMSPTVQELAVELGMKAPSVFEGLKRLEDKGYIRKQARKARSIEILHAQTSDKTNLTAIVIKIRSDLNKILNEDLTKKDLLEIQSIIKAYKNKLELKKL